MPVANAHLNELPVEFSVCVSESQDKLPTMYWLPKIHESLLLVLPLNFLNY